MKQYIDKAAVMAEIEKRKQELHPTDTHKMQIGEKMDRDVLMWLNALNWIKKVIDTLEMKEEPVSNGLEQAANDYVGHAPEIDEDLSVYSNREAFKAGAQWQKEQILGDDNKQYHRLRHGTLKRLYENEAKLELMLDNALEGYIEKYEQIGGHNYLLLKIPMLSKPDDYKDDEKVKLIIIKEE